MADLNRDVFTFTIVVVPTVTEIGTLQIFFENMKYKASKVIYNYKERQ